MKMSMVGQKDTYGESGKPDELKKKYGMTSDDIIKAVKRTTDIVILLDFIWNKAPGSVID